MDPGATIYNTLLNKFLSNKSQIRSTFTIFGIGAITATLTYIVYTNALNSLIFLDDLSNLLAFDGSKNNLWQQILYHIFEGPKGRIITRLSFLLNSIISGENYAQWKHVNIALHITCGILLFNLLFYLSRLSGYCRTKSLWFSICCASLWLLHPLHVSTVLYTVQRLTILTTIFSVLTLQCYINVRLRQITKSASPLPWALLGSTCFLFALLSKENGILVGFYVLLIEWGILRRYRRPVYWYGNRYTIFFGALPSIFIAVYIALFFDSIITHGYLTRSFNLEQRLLTELRVIVFYIQSVLFPNVNQLAFIHDDYNVSTSLISPITTLYSLIALCLLLGIAYATRYRHRIFSFGIIVFFISQLLESTFIPLELVFEHRTYLGSWGLIIAFLYPVFTYKFQPKLKVANMAIVIIIIMVFTFVLINRLNIWSNPELFYNHIAASHPNSLRVRHEIAIRQLSEKRYDEAKKTSKDFPASIQILLDARTQCNQKSKYTPLLNSNLFPPIIADINPHVLSNLYVLIGDYLDDKCTIDPKFLLAWNDRLLLSDTLPTQEKGDLWLYKAHIFRKLAIDDESESAIYEATKIYRHNPYPFFQLVKWNLADNRVELAGINLEKAIQEIAFWDYLAFNEAKELAEQIPGFTYNITPQIETKHFEITAW